MLKKIIFLICLFLSTIVFAAPEKPLIVVLDWFANPNHAPIFVAEQEGFYQAQNLTVKIIAPANIGEGEKMVAAGQADIALTTLPWLIKKTNAGLPLIRIATLVGQPLDAVLVLKNSTIQAIKDLKGKKVGYSTPGGDNIMFKTMLEYNGLTIKDVEMICVHYDLTQALLSGRIDAFTDASRNFEPLEMELAGKPVREFYPEKNGVPSYEEIILVANKTKSNDPRLAKFLVALKQGFGYMKQHPTESWLKFAKNHPELNNELNKRAWFLTVPLFVNDPIKLDGKKYDAFAKFMYQNKIINTLPGLSDIAR